MRRWKNLSLACRPIGTRFRCLIRRLVGLRDGMRYWKQSLEAIFSHFSMCDDPLLLLLVLDTMMLSQHCWYKAIGYKHLLNTCCNVAHFPPQMDSIHHSFRLNCMYQQYSGKVTVHLGCAHTSVRDLGCHANIEEKKRSEHQHPPTPAGPANATYQNPKTPPVGAAKWRRIRRDAYSAKIQNPSPWDMLAQG